MKLKLVSLEDGTTACGFRKFAAHAALENPDTTTHYVSTSRWATVRGAIKGEIGGKGELGADEVDEIAQGLRGADVVGFSSMTGYSELTRDIAARLREIDPSSYIIWGGIHPIIHPEDAIRADVDAICTGEGEFAFSELMGRLQAGEDPASVKNFWFKPGRANGATLEHAGDDGIARNLFLPLMTSEDMERLPFSSYAAPGEQIYRPGEGFVDMTREDYLANDGLGYTAIWSVGCPFHCTYCGNTVFIANDRQYKKIRHASARYIVDEIKSVRARSPHLSTVAFLDDSFMAIPYKQLEEFAELWKAELDLPFSVYGVIPNYVKQDKFEILTWAGMNRIRMGIQSGSRRILEFYERPSPPEKILAAGKVTASFSPRFHIPPVYDVIMDNPIETRQDVVDTLELLYEMPRPYSLLIYSLKVIPNTGLERALREEGVDIEEIDSSYLWIPPRAANLLLYVLGIWRPPRWLWNRLLRSVRASTEPQRLYPRLGLVLRTLFLIRRTLGHMRQMDFSITRGKAGYWAWRLGLVSMRRRFLRRMDRPVRPPRESRIAARKAVELAVERSPVVRDGQA